MWKYVSRRIRDVCDRTYNVLDVRRPWQCGGERFCAEVNPSDEKRSSSSSRKDGAVFCVVPWKQPEVGKAGRTGSDTGSSGSEREGFRRKEYCAFQPSWIGAITWTSAIICGWYTSQLICLYRRNHKWDGPKCVPFLISSAHSIPRDLSTKCFFSGPPPSPPIEAPRGNEQQKQSESSAEKNSVTFLGVPIPNGKPSRLEEFDFEEIQPIRINNEDRQNQKSHVYVVNGGTGSQLPAVELPQQAPTVESAMQNLVSVIGEIEYQLGVQNLEAGDYGTAVSHLKLGTSHQHAGAAFNLGICFEQGFGVKKNPRVAMECFQLASSLGHPQAMYNLGVYYARGLGGLRRSRSMAKRYFTAAADLGLEQAIDALGAGYRARREPMMSSGPSSAGSTPSPVVPFEFKFDLEELERYGFVGGYKSPIDQRHQFEVQLVSAMG